jgi:hypothetical protein
MSPVPPPRTGHLATSKSAGAPQRWAPARPGRWSWRGPRGLVLRRLSAVVAAVAQFTLILATGADSWHGRDASAHVERTGTQLHHAHNEASCVACTAQTMHAQAAAPAVVAWPDASAPHCAAASLAANPPRSRDCPSNGSRAPPLTS